MAYLDGRATLEEAVAKGQGDTRAYSKRQFTFARHQLPEFAWVAPARRWRGCGGPSLTPRPASATKSATMKKLIVSRAPKPERV